MEDHGDGALPPSVPSAGRYVPGPGLIHGFAAFLGVVDAAEANLEQILASLGRLMRSQAAPT